MKYVILFSVIIVYACSNTISHSKLNRICFKITYTTGNKTGQNTIFSDTSFATYYDGMVLYELPYHQTHSFGDTIVYDSLKYHYLLCRENAHRGYFLNRLKDSLEQIVDVDSVIGYNSIYRHSDIYDSLRPLLPGTMVKTELDQNRFMLTGLVKGHYAMDSVHLFFNTAFPKVPYSLSKALDSMYQATLVNVVTFICNSKDTAHYGTKFTLTYGVDTARAADEKLYENLFIRLAAKQSN
ncbi:MAG: hypothetical protein JST86_03825 [Bacteroidetes bacterium]|nr:hypothetical protein [Bacteroidota bacterium]